MFINDAFYLENTHFHFRKSVLRAQLFMYMACMSHFTDSFDNITIESVGFCV